MKTSYYVIFAVIGVIAIFPIISIVFYGAVPVGINTRYFEICEDCELYGCTNDEIYDHGICMTPEDKERAKSVGDMDESKIPTFDYVIESDDVTYGSQYQIVGGTIDGIIYDKHSNSLIVLLSESEQGFLQILIQTGLLHSLDQSPFTYFVLVDGDEVFFEQLSPILLKIPFEKDTKKIEIIGTNKT